MKPSYFAPCFPLTLIRSYETYSKLWDWKDKVPIFSRNILMTHSRDIYGCSLNPSELLANDIAPGIKREDLIERRERHIGRRYCSSFV